MTQASVGFHCPECSRRGQQRVYTARTLRRAGGRPIVTQTLIAVNVLVFVLGLSRGSGDILSGTSAFAEDYGLLGSAVVRIGGQVFSAPIGVAHGEWWRLVTGGFLHAGLLHIGFNMFALWILGSQLEAAVGRTRFAVVYGTSLLAGSLGVMILSPHDPTVGASGAIFGLFGLALAAQRSQGINIWQSGLGGILLINLAFTFGVPGISIGGHLGGLAGGYLCGVLLYELGPRMTNRVVSVVLCGALGAVCFVAAIVAASASV
jgi:membrane associated rhomboid family serine protease